VFSVFKREHKRQLAQMEDQQSMFKKQLNTRDSTISDWLQTFDQIESDLGQIKQKQDILSVKSNDTEFTKARRDKILEDITMLNTLIDNNKKKIADLTAKLNNSGASVKGLQAKIASYEGILKKYEADLSALKDTLSKKEFEIKDLNQKIEVKDAAIAQKDETINNQTNSMNTAYLVSGTYKELKEKGIVSREGGFLGLGKTGVIAGNVSNDKFSVVDIRNVKTIDVNARAAKLITRHPSNSYTMVKEGDKNMISRIEINDPDNFWKLSKYAVVEVVK